MDLHERYVMFCRELVDLTTRQGFKIDDAGTSRLGVLWINLIDENEWWRTLQMTPNDVTLTNTTDPDLPESMELETNNNEER